MLSSTKCLCSDFNRNAFLFHCIVTMLAEIQVYLPKKRLAR